MPRVFIPGWEKYSNKRAGMQIKTFIFYFFLVILALSVWGRDSADARSQTNISFAFGRWVPMDHVDDSGRGCGVLVDIAREVFENELGLKLVCIERPWKRAQLEVKNGTSDFMVTVSTEARNAYALASQQAFYSLPLFVYTYSGHRQMAAIHKIRSAGDIRALRLRSVSNLGNGWHKDNIDAAGICTHYVGTDENVLLFLANKRADIMIDALIPTNYLIRKMGLDKSIVLTRSRFSRVDLHLLLSRKSRFASWMPKIDAAFANVRKKGRIASIISGYSMGGSIK